MSYYSGYMEVRGVELSTELSITIFSYLGGWEVGETAT